MIDNLKKSFSINFISFDNNFLISDVFSVSSVNDVGSFIILSTHEPFLTNVSNCIMYVNLKNKNSKVFFISSGIIEVNYEGCFVLSEEFSELNDSSINSIVNNRKKIIESVDNFSDMKFVKEVERELSYINNYIAKA